ncbi:hypothetical protein [Halorarum salinum]|uniref:Uncharacterized protein n=1 Tax=Halorarum salinum TaxID=2743089 RepID=A0A7D5LAP2_9EURY|nr:hypothetical protein [Halobaculum salinum]QLG62068.1 hypothetical protein HUG12_10145 [Halobaculum salinum]
MVLINRRQLMHQRWTAHILMAVLILVGGGVLFWAAISGGSDGLVVLGGIVCFVGLVVLLGMMDEVYRELGWFQHAGNTEGDA